MRSRSWCSWGNFFLALLAVSETSAALPPEVLAKNACGATVMVRNREGRKTIGKIGRAHV